MAEQSERIMKKPESNVIQISSKKPVRHFVFIAKVYMKYFGNIELHALGEATAYAVQVAAQLERHQYATFTKINSFAHNTEKENEQNQDNQQGSRTKQKLVVELAKSKQFDELAKDIKIQE